MPAEKDDPAAADVIDFLRRMQPARCRHCDRKLCGHQLVINLLMGYKEHPICVACLCDRLEQELAGFVDHVAAYVRQRECYRAGWDWANREEGVTGPGSPPCLLRMEGAGPGPVERDQPPAGAPPARAGASDELSGAELSGAELLDVSAEWDAGDLSCGDLVLELRLRVQALDPGSVLRLRASDPSAQKDLPAWCRLTGNRLLRASHPVYWIRRESG